MTDINEEFEYAGFLIRLFTSIISIILTCMITCIIILPVLIFVFNMGYDLFIYEWIVGVYNSGQYGIYYLITLLVFVHAFVVIFFWMSYQATLGKMLIGAKIVDVYTGNKPSLGQFIGRYLVFYLFSLPIFGMGILWIAFDRRKQGWHDKFAGTIVIIEKKYVKDVEFKTE